MRPNDLATRARDALDDAGEDREADQMVRGYLAITRGDPTKALRLLASDRIAELNARDHLRRIALNRRLKGMGAHHG